MRINMPHHQPSLRLTAMRAVLAIAGIFAASQAAAQVTLYEDAGFRGRAFTTSKAVSNFERLGFNDRASSVIVDHGRWEVCEDAQFQGRCVALRPGSYDSLSAMGINDRVSSIRPIGQQARYVSEAPPPLPAPTYDYRQRPNERLFQANVTSARAVVGPPEQRCWVERQQVNTGNANVPGAIVGAILGGVLGHQVGGGRGQDIATAGGAVAGAAIGANTGNGAGRVYGQDVQRCSDVPSGQPAFWDVTYNFRGLEHRVQMSAPPGSTITVNGNGEPRG
jgi:uncharacterized protein YcfJ